MSSVLHPRRVRKAKSNATSKLAGAIVVSVVIVLLLISVALWFLAVSVQTTELNKSRKLGTRDRTSTICEDVPQFSVDQLSMYDYATASDIHVVLRDFGGRLFATPTLI